jgi:hypothetical protein
MPRMRTSITLLVSCLTACWTTQAPPPPTTGQPMTQLPAPAPKGKTLTVTCQFEQGWATVLPRSVFKKDDPFTMQALIGLTEEPAFWKGLAEYTHLAPYAAQRCGDKPALFDNLPVDAILLVGKAGTFGQNGGGYGINGLVRDLSGGGEISVADKDLDISWSCISCPRLYAWNGRVWELRGEVLVDLIGAGAEKTQRRSIGKVRVIGGQVRLRLAEEEEEVSHVDALLLEIKGRSIAPSAGPLRAVDGTRAVMVRGDAIELRYAVALPDGEYAADVAATGYYLPLGRLH